MSLVWVGGNLIGPKGKEAIMPLELLLAKREEIEAQIIAEKIGLRGNEEQLEDIMGKLCAQCQLLTKVKGRVAKKMVVEKDQFIKVRDLFRETADLIDELLALGEREDKGEDVTEPATLALAKFMLKMAELMILTRQIKDV